MFYYLSKMNKGNLLVFAFVFSCVLSKAQNPVNESLVVIKIEAIQPNRGPFIKTDSFLVRKDFILETIKINYFAEETNLGTGVSKQLVSGKRLQAYNLTNYQEMIGMSFDIEKKPSAKTIEIYRVGDGNKKGVRFFTEPYLSNGMNLSDLVKDKDTTINGTKYILLKNNRAIDSPVKGNRGDRISQVRVLIDPTLKSYSYPFISEKIVNEFGGGAIMYVALITEAGLKTTVHYTYSPFRPSDTDLFNKYQELYNQNIALLDKLRKK